MRNLSVTFFLFFFTSDLFSQNFSGEFNSSLQSYQEDTKIEASSVDEIIRNNAYLNLNYSKDNFTAGLRYESYLNALLDYNQNFRGNGIAYRFATYYNQGLEITAGNYYEQLGSGLIFRSYEDKGLGIDNSMDGIRLKYNPYNGLYIKSFIGKSRTYFEYADGIFRGADAEINFNELVNKSSKTTLIMGGSFISRYQQRNNAKFEIPQNVGAFSSRINIIRGGWNYYGEYAYKINDPGNSLQEKNMNYASGNAIHQNITFSKRGMGFSAQFQRVDNMSFLSDRDSDQRAYIINYIPTLSKQHTYSLMAMYPCATQADGEFGMQFDVFYKIQKGTLLGGKYGTKLAFNYSKINSLNGGPSFKNDKREHKPMLISIIGEDLFYKDINLEITKKINRKISTNFVFANQTYNRDVLEGKTIGEYGILNSTIFVSDITYKIKSGHSLRIELQTLKSKQLEKSDLGNYENGMIEPSEGDWSMALFEYTISPNWFFTVQDMYNHGHELEEKRLHFMNFSAGFLNGSHRFEIGYGKKKGGIYCVGGVCKPVFPSNGFSLNISSSF